MIEVLVAHHGGAVREARLVEELRVHRLARVERDRSVAGEDVFAVPLVEHVQPVVNVC